MPIIGTIASSIRTSSGSYESLATLTPTTGNVFDFTSIPAGYAHLQLRGITTLTTFPDQMILGFNGSNATATHSFYMQSTSAGTSYYSGDMRVFYNTTIGDSTNAYTAFIVDILDYRSTAKNKTVRMFGGLSNSGVGNITLSSAYQATSTAITTLRVTFGNNVRANTTLALYGIKGA